MKRSSFLKGLAFGIASHVCVNIHELNPKLFSEGNNPLGWMLDEVDAWPYQSLSFRSIKFAPDFKSCEFVIEGYDGTKTVDITTGCAIRKSDMGII